MSRGASNAARKNEEITDAALQDMLKDRKTAEDKAEDDMVKANGAIDDANAKLEDARFARIDSRATA